MTHKLTEAQVALTDLHAYLDQISETKAKNWIVESCINSFNYSTGIHVCHVCVDSVLSL